MNKKILILIGVILLGLFVFLIWYYWVELDDQDNKEINLETTKLATIPVELMKFLGMGLRITFSPDGKKVAHTIYKDKKWFFY
ncbi:MAG: hypothetical protein U9Q96_01130 [Patescibacteria group bacterium]|nr:hypothetical protein [Patescibacteria group bacterium]